jgi:CheY-like chemotaxis protein/HPt (histidine-containing phosphotransfer) domain-containing protein
MEVETAASGEEGIQTAQRAREEGNPFRLVLLDAHMGHTSGFAAAVAIQTAPNDGTPIIMMLTTERLKRDTARCRELEISAYVQKPVKECDLLRAIRAVLNRSQNVEDALVMPPSRDDEVSASDTPETWAASHRGRRVLVAEDNPVNQRLVTALLEKAGCEVVVVPDGHKVIELWEAQDFDLILMDLQMPRLDGFEVTRAIREKEASHTAGAGSSSPGRIPIIAVTAHALNGNREKCLQAGMDGYVTKPIRRDVLYEAIDRCLAPADEGPSPRQSGSINLEQLTESVEGDQDLLTVLIETFLEDAPTQLERLEQAVESRELDLVGRGAHRFRGSVSVFGAEFAAEMAERLEDTVEDSNADAIEAAFAGLSAEVQNVFRELREYSSSTPNQTSA